MRIRILFGEDQMRTAFVMAIGLCLVVFATRPKADPGADVPKQADAAKVPSFPKEKVAFFEGKVLPLLKSKCFKCHGGEGKFEGKLDLTRRSGILKGGESGEAVDLKKPSESMILSALRYESFKMPPTGKLGAGDIGIFEKWIEMGLPWSAKDQVVKPRKAHVSPVVSAKTKAHWSFRPITRPKTPAFKNKNWIANDIDAFVLDGLQKQGLKPNAPAKKIELLRRVTYDLIGLPPTPEEVRAFLADNSKDAYEKAVDRLLKSPHYGEKWGRHWLDLVRYAESNSYERDGAKPFVWRYRDYVIKSLNEDKPYDQFLLEQLAGDELPKVTADSIIATGYYRLGIWDDEPADRQQAIFDQLDDIANTTGQVFLGITVGCARCHEHKLDPIPHADYYRFLAYFRNVRQYGIRGGNTVADRSIVMITTEDDRKRHAEVIAKHKKQIDDLTKQMGVIEDKAKKGFIPVEVEEFAYPNRRPDLLKKQIGKKITKKEFDHYMNLRKRRAQMIKAPPKAASKALAVKERGPNAPKTHVLARGNPHAPGNEVQPGLFSVLADVVDTQPRIPQPKAGQRSTNRRLTLARWMVSKKNPLTARVMANRLWQHHFGRGIVESPNNFGLHGRAPTHPKLLDWLADEFMAGGWKLKRMHKLIVMSNTYRMSSRSNDVGEKTDPTNRWLWRFNPRRLSAEEIRDSILAATGELNKDKMFGPSIYTRIPREVLAGQSRPGAGWGRSSKEDENRRSIYIHVKRSLIDPLLASFDYGETDLSCPVRFTTTQPTQALGMLNSDFSNEQAKIFAASLMKNAKTTRERIALGFVRATQRPATDADIARGERLFKRMTEKYKLPEEQALKQVCLVFLNLNEFMYLD